METRWERVIESCSFQLTTTNPSTATKPRRLLHSLSLVLCKSMEFLEGEKWNYSASTHGGQNQCEAWLWGVLPEICWVLAKIFVWNLFVSWENKGGSVCSYLVFTHVREREKKKKNCNRASPPKNTLRKIPKVATDLAMAIHTSSLK